MKLPLFKRPEHLSTDKAKTKSVLLHHLKWMKKIIMKNMNI